MTALVPERNVATLESGIARLQARARKLGVEPPALAWGAWVERTTYRWPADRARPETAERVADGQVAVIRRFREVEVTGEPPRLPGWTFVAVIEHGDAELGNVVRDLPGESCPTEYRHAPPTCDHCHLARRRSETFVVRHDDGHHARVGRQCLRDFLGQADPEALARAAELFAAVGALVRDSESEGGGGGYVRAFYAAEDVISTAVAVIGAHGWVSRKEAEARLTMSTATTVEAMLSPRSNGERAERETLEPAILAAGVEAETIIAWAHDLRARDDLSDYLHNVAVVLAGSVAERHLGIAVSAVPSYRRERGEAVERARAAEVSHHVGTVGKRTVFRDLTVLSVRDLESAYGVTHLYVFADPVGNRLKWFASRTCGVPGDVVTIKATVKGHETYRGVAETVLTRGARVEEETR